MRRSRRGFRLGRRVVNIFSHILLCRSRRKHPSPLYTRLLTDTPDDHPNKNKTVTKIIHKWGQTLKRRAKELCHIKPSAAAPPRRYRRLGGGGEEVEAVAVPKGHLAVYVEAVEAAERHRFLVPVIYFNHPLFGELLREAERVYGFHQQGGITIPCPVSEFQNVKARVSAACRKATPTFPSSLSLTALVEDVLAQTLNIYRRCDCGRDEVVGSAISGCRRLEPPKP
ncbi:hypothetical protein Syun_012642 [Stephania yunnanensis]|uniref:Small auxin up regulated protein n=1 Tax=Stephania yunnanensis TaxID=152371 RepID=A0AAP0PGK5_9MAGN